MTPPNASPANPPALIPTTPTEALALKDIHLPEQISQYPIAYGWWVLSAIMLILLAFFIYKTIKNRQLKAKQRQALKQLKSNPTMTHSEIITLLKWAAMQYFPRPLLAKLYGLHFQQFLLQHLAEKYQQKFKLLTSAYFEQQYKNNSLQTEQQEIPELYQAARLWLTRALPPKAKHSSALNHHKSQGENA